MLPVNAYDIVVAAIVYREHWSHDEATAVVDAAFAAGFTIPEIVDILHDRGVDTLILNSWSRVTFPIEGGPL